MKKKNQLSTNLVKIDQGYIQRHCLDKEFWKKSWTIFKYKGIEDVIRLVRINIDRNTYTIESSVSGLTTTNEMPFDRNDFTDKMFNAKLLESFEFLVDYQLNADDVIRSSIYKGYSAIDQANEDKAIKEADEYCDQHNIQDKDLIDAVEDKFKEKRKTGEASAYYFNTIHAMRNDVKAACAYWLGLEDKAKQFEDAINPKFRKEQVVAYMRAMKKFKAENPEEE